MNTRLLLLLAAFVDTIPEPDKQNDFVVCLQVFWGTNGFSSKIRNVKGQKKSNGDPINFHDTISFMSAIYFF